MIIYHQIQTTISDYGRSNTDEEGDLQARVSR